MRTQSSRGGRLAAGVLVLALVVGAMSMSNHGAAPDAGSATVVVAAAAGAPAGSHGAVVAGTPDAAGKCGFWCKVRKGWHWVKRQFERIRDWLCRHDFIDCGNNGR